MHTFSYCKAKFSILKFKSDHFDSNADASRIWPVKLPRERELADVVHSSYINPGALLCKSNLPYYSLILLLLLLFCIIFVGADSLFNGIVDFLLIITISQRGNCSQF